MMKSASPERCAGESSARPKPTGKDSCLRRRSHHGRTPRRVYARQRAPASSLDLDAHYFSVLRWVVPLMSIYILLDIPDTLLHGGGHFERLGGMRYAGVLVAWVALLYIPLLLTRRRWLHWLLFGLGLAVTLIAQVTFNTSVIR